MWLATLSQYTSDVTYYHYRILFLVQSEIKRLINEEGATVDATDHQYNNNVYTDMKLLWHRRETIFAAWKAIR